MNTPILDFINNYNNSDIARMHMPGHKGHSILGVENYDITEIKGADALFLAEGIIGESEANATTLFGSERTVYSTEGSSQCIRAMLTQAALYKKHRSPLFIAGRNAHKAFIYAAAMLDAEVNFLYPEKEEGVCGCFISPEALERELLSAPREVTAVYVTSPDYLGNMLDIKALAEVCHRYKTLLLVDNAHGAYLHFLKKSKHPLDLGADMCCDSAHKTFSVVTGGAYLHISKNAPKKLAENIKSVMEMYSSTSPSYITLASLDYFNSVLAKGYARKLEETIVRLQALKKRLKENGIGIVDSDPLKLTIAGSESYTGNKLAELLREKGAEPEYADKDYLVLMLTPDNQERDFELVEKAFCDLRIIYEDQARLEIPRLVRKMSIREALFAPQKRVDTKKTIGKICASPVVSCPPAIPIVITGEEINEEAVKVMSLFGIDSINIVI